MNYTEGDYVNETGQAIEDARRRIFLEFIQKVTIGKRKYGQPAAERIAPEKEGM